LRSVLALAGGMARDLVDSPLRFLIEQVGQVEGAYVKEAELPKDFLVRRTAGNVLEVAGCVAFRALPGWVLARLPTSPAPAATWWPTSPRR
jgi:hypothetical protein